MFGMGFQELALVLFIVMLLFGAKRVPEIAKSLGKAVNAFKSGMKEGDDDVHANGKSADEPKKNV